MRLSDGLKTNNPPCCVAALHSVLFSVTVGVVIVHYVSSPVDLFYYDCRNKLKEAQVASLSAGITREPNVHSWCYWWD